MAEVSIEQVREAEKLLAEGWSQRRAARQARVGLHTVRAIARGEPQPSCQAVARCERCAGQVAPCRGCAAAHRERLRKRLFSDDAHGGASCGFHGHG